MPSPTADMVLVDGVFSGQAAFLFVLTSSIAPLVHLTYGQMVYMAAPYTVMLAIWGYFGTVHLVE